MRFQDRGLACGTFNPCSAEGWDVNRNCGMLTAMNVTIGHFEGLDGVFHTHLPVRRRCQIMLETVSGLMALGMPEHDIRPLREEIGLAV